MFTFSDGGNQGASRNTIPGVWVAREEAMDSKDIYRTAKIMMDLYGDEAPIRSAMKADRCLDSGDLEGVAVWKSVIQAIDELSATSGPMH